MYAENTLTKHFHDVLFNNSDPKDILSYYQLSNIVIRIKLKRAQIYAENTFTEHFRDLFYNNLDKDILST